VIGGATDRDARLDEALQGVAERRPVRIADRDVVQARRSGGRRRPLTTLPRVQAKVMVVAACAEEGRIVAEALSHLKPQHVAVEREGSVDVRDLEVNVPDVDARIDRLAHQPSLRAGESAHKPPPFETGWRARFVSKNGGSYLLSRLRFTCFDAGRYRHQDGPRAMEEARTTGPESIGRRLRRLRLERNLSQRELSCPGVSYAYISRIEAGARRPSVKALRQLARKLGVSVEYLETGSDLRDVDQRELRLADAELELRLTDDPTKAQSLLQEILDEAVASGDSTSALRARISIGLAEARAGDNAAAARRLEEAIASNLLAPSQRPDVYATLGQCYAALGQPQRAVDLFESCLTRVVEESPEDTTNRVRFSTYLSYALSDLGDLSGAETVLEDALDQADLITDAYTRVRLYWSLARLNEIRGQPAAALDP